jgi:hypothetical protein
VAPAIEALKDAALRVYPESEFTRRIRAKA